MKRFLAALLCALMAGTVLAFAACSDGSSEGGEGNGNGGTPQTPVNPDAELPSFFLWRRERDSRLRRTRPDKQRVSAVWFAYRACGCLNFCANCSLPLASPPSNPSQYSVHSPQKKRALLPSFFVAEREGFEPPDSCPSTVFKTAAFDRSAISPRLN